MRALLRFVIAFTVVVGSVLTFGVCDPTGDEPGSVVLRVSASGDGLVTCQNDLGWQVEVTGFRLAVRDIEFTIEGEVHEAMWNVSDLIVPEAMAHPGHYAGGEVTGELPGRFLLDLIGDDAQELGDATLLEGDYNGFNLYFTIASEEDGLAEDDPLLGHTALIDGTALSGDEEVEFHAVLDVEEGVQMVGGVFEMDVKKSSTGTIIMEVLTVDPSEGDTLFDGIDFGALDGDEDGVVEILQGEAIHNVLMKTLQIHDQYYMEVTQ